MRMKEGAGYSEAESPATAQAPPLLDVVTVVGKECRPEECEMPLHIGLFFDGTGNNWEWVEPGYGHTQLQRQKDSNVYRLFTSYPDDLLGGYYRMYIPGVGTPFPEIGEAEASTSGQAFGAGGDGRINYGLLHVFNSVYRMIANDARIVNVNSVRALCRNGAVAHHSTRDGGAPIYNHWEDAAALSDVGMANEGGLLGGGSREGDRRRTAFFRRLSSTLATQVLDPKTKPKLTELFIDVFGFSRGAASARVFCSWLVSIMEAGKLCGIPAKIRFLGIFDTVASVGIPASMPLGLGQLGDGHLGWASAEALRIPPEVENCMHFVAMHENRPSFPLDFVRLPSAGLPANCKEYAFPGMHSDVGGGYTPQDQGRGPEGLNSQKLSQIPLNQMYQAAVDAEVPLDKELAEVVGATGRYDPFEIHPNLQAAYDSFTAAGQSEGRSLQAWLVPYLAWRYQVRGQYMSLPWHQRASAQDIADLEGANALLENDIRALDASDTFGEKVWNAALSAVPVTHGNSENRTLAMLAPEAREVLGRLRQQPVAAEAHAVMFQDYSHDSYAGFRPLDYRVASFFGLSRRGGWEAEGYLRYRRWFAGDNTQMTWRNQARPDDTAQA